MKVALRILFLFGLLTACILFCVYYEEMSDAMLGGRTDDSTQFALGFEDIYAWPRCLNGGVGSLEVSEEAFRLNALAAVFYEKQIAFDSISFEYRHSLPITSSEWNIVYFAKNNRTDPLGHHNATGYGMLIRGNGVLELLKIYDGQWQFESLGRLATGLDFRTRQKVTIEMKPDSSKVDIKIVVNDDPAATLVASDERTPHSTRGYLGFECRHGMLEFSNVTGLGVVSPLMAIVPHDVLLLHGEPEPGKVTLRWRYYLPDTPFSEVRIYEGNKLLGNVKYPGTSWSLEGLENDKAYTFRVKTVSRAGQESRGVDIIVVPGTYTARESMAPLPRIAVSPDNPAHFINADTGEPFVPNGVNLIRLMGDHANFIPEVYDPHEVDHVLELMRNFGYNVVRIFISGRYPIIPGISGDLQTTEGLDEVYMDNVVDFLRRAADKGIYVIPTLIYIPINQYFNNLLGGPIYQNGQIAISGINKLFMTEAGLNAKREYIQRFLNYIKEKDPSLLTCIFSLQIENEEYMSAVDAPFNLQHGIVKTADGGTYDMSDPDSRQACFHNNAVNYLNEMVKTVKEIDPALMVSESIFSYNAVALDPERNHGIQPIPWTSADPRVPFDLKSLAESDLDYLDFHFYPTTTDTTGLKAEFDRHLESSGFSEIQGALQTKPIFLGEYGMFTFVTTDSKKAANALQVLRDYSYELGFRGWALWTFDTEEQAGLLHGSFDDHVINRALGSYDPTP